MLGSEERPRAHPAVDTLSGLFAAAALFFGLVALAYHPVPVGVAASLLALISAGMSPRYQLLSVAALAVAGLCFIAGISIAIFTDNPLW